MGTPSPSLPHFLKPPRAAQALPGAPISRSEECGPPPPSMTKIEERKGRARDVPVPGPAQHVKKALAKCGSFLYN